VSEEVSYKRLRDLLREEKSSPALARLEQEFYPSVEKFLSESFSKVESSPSVLKLREFENATATIREMSLLRQQKILFRALRGRGASSPPEEMTREEYATYDRFCAIILEENSRLEGLLARFERHEARAKAKEEARTLGSLPDANGGAPLEKAPQAEPSRNTIKKVRFLKDLSAYVGANKETVGPFKSGDEGALPSEEADWLLKQKIAEMAQ
jgi:DNA replication initiation complex subunit (GINS family)